MFDRIQTYSFANIDHLSTAGLVTRLTTEVTNVQNAYQMMLRMMMRAPASMVCAMVMYFAVVELEKWMTEHLAIYRKA